MVLMSPILGDDRNLQYSILGRWYKVWELVSQCSPQTGWQEVSVFQWHCLIYIDMIFLIVTFLILFRPSVYIIVLWHSFVAIVWELRNQPNAKCNNLEIRTGCSPSPPHPTAPHPGADPMLLGICCFAKMKKTKMLLGIMEEVLLEIFAGNFPIRQIHSSESILPAACLLNAWCLVLDVWCLMLGAWCLLINAWCLLA